MRRWLAPAAGLLVVLVVTLVGLDLFVDRVLPVLVRSTPSPSSPAASPTVRLLEPAELWALAGETAPVPTSHGPAQLTTIAVGQVLLPSGRIIVADPFLTHGVAALGRTVDPGRYPVSVVVARFPDTDQRVALATARITPGQPVAWELAKTADQAAASLAPDQLLGYGVDSGNGSFSSPEAAAVLAARPASSGTDDDPILVALNKNAVDSWSSADVILDPATGLDVVAFSSGWGDGAYPSWWGLDADGHAIVLMTDFGVLDAPLGRPPGTVPAPSASPAGPSPSPSAASSAPPLRKASASPS
jgi:hypothetical protein